MLALLKKKLRRIQFKAQVAGPFGWYDRYHNGYYQGTVLAYGVVHALEQAAGADTYLRDDDGFAVALNPCWRAEFSYAPGSPKARDDAEPFRLAFLQPYVST